MSLAYGKCATRKQGDGNKLFIYRFSSFFCSLESKQKCLHADNVAWDEEKTCFFICERYRCAFHPHLWGNHHHGNDCLRKMMMMAVVVVKLQPLRWKRIHCVFYELEVIFCERKLKKNKVLRVFLGKKC